MITDLANTRKSFISLLARKPFYPFTNSMNIKFMTTICVYAYKLFRYVYWPFLCHSPMVDVHAYTSSNDGLFIKKFLSFFSFFGWWKRVNALKWVRKWNWFESKESKRNFSLKMRFMNTFKWTQFVHAFNISFSFSVDNSLFNIKHFFSFSVASIHAARK